MLVLLLGMTMQAVAPTDIGQAKLEPPPLVRPDWRRRPGLNDVLRAYPRLAGGRDGQAVIRCKVEQGGRLGDCLIVSETPAALGFGSAALKLAKFFEVAPLDRDGATAEGRWITIPFLLYNRR